MDRGLGTPKTFRAGGWTADASTLLALDDNGYVADSSALNWQYIEEWKGKELYTWTMSHWSQITDTSQPYYPSTTDPQASQPGSNIKMLEVPDNGVMIDYVSVAQMSDLRRELRRSTPRDGAHLDDGLPPCPAVLEQ